MNNSPHLNKEWLYQKYVDEELSTYDIGKIVNRDPKRIYEKLRDFHIPTRPRGLNLKGSDHWTKQPNAVNPFFGKQHTPETRAVLSEKASVPKPYLRGSANGMYGKKGIDNPNYKGGSTPERQLLYSSREWRELQCLVFRRDNYTCQKCGDHSGRLHAHHIAPWALSVSRRKDANNLITLCPRCHRWVHSNANTKQLFLDLSAERKEVTA